MKKLRCFYAGLIFLLLFVLSGLICSCESEPEPKLTEPIVTLMLSETSPQREVIISWTPSDDAESYSVERTMARDSISEERFFSWSSSDPLCSQDDGKFYLTDNTCEPGTEYTYVVTASAQRYVPITYETYSKSSKEKSITTAADPKVTLSYPKNVKVEPTTGKPNALTISWMRFQMPCNMRFITAAAGTLTLMNYIKKPEKHRKPLTRWNTLAIPFIIIL